MGTHPIVLFEVENSNTRRHILDYCMLLLKSNESRVVLHLLGCSKFHCRTAADSRTHHLFECSFREMLLLLVKILPITFYYIMPVDAESSKKLDPTQRRTKPRSNEGLQSPSLAAATSTFHRLSLCSLAKTMFTC
jgi:hypothetical protein